MIITKAIGYWGHMRRLNSFQFEVDKDNYRNGILILASRQESDALIRRRYDFEISKAA